MHPTHIAFHLEVIQGIRKDLTEDLGAARDAAARLGTALAADGDLLGFPRVGEAARALNAAAGRKIEALQERLDRLEDSLRDLVADQGSRTALVVEDDSDTAHLVRQILGNCGFPTVLVARTGAEARALAAEHVLDAVVLDLVLPDVDGRSLLFEFRRRPGMGGVPIVVMSAVRAASARAECLAYGADAFLSKPIDPEVLGSTLFGLGSRARLPKAEPDALTRLAGRSLVGTEFDFLQDSRAKNEFPVAIALLEVEPKQGLEGTGPDAADGAARLVALLRKVVVAVQPHLRDEDTLGRWSVNTLVLVSVTRSAPELAGLLRELKMELNWREDALFAGISEASPDESFMDAVSQAGLRLAGARTEGSDGINRGESSLAPGRRIVLAEDDPVTAGLVCHRLGRSGFQVRHYENGAEAFAAILDDPPSLAILDVQMPGMDGFELLARLKEDRRTRGVRTIVFTSMGRESDVSRGFQLGADDYLVKPFSPRELLARVLRLIRE